MRTKWVLTTAVVALSVTAAVGAQSETSMRQPSNGNAMSVTYTGCVESANHGAAFLLTKIDSGGAESMHGDRTMKHHGDIAMKQDDTAMKNSAVPMQQERAPMADEKDEKMDAMTSKSFALAGPSDLSKHVGQTVSVTGSLSNGTMGTMRQDVSTLTIKTLKVIAKSCS